MKTTLKTTELIIENLNVVETITIEGGEINTVEVTRYDVTLRGSVIIQKNLGKPQNPSEAPIPDFLNKKGKRDRTE